MSPLSNSLYTSFVSSFSLFGFIYIIIDHAFEYDDSIYGNENVCFDYVVMLLREFQGESLCVVMFSVCFDMWKFRKLASDILPVIRLYRDEWGGGENDRRF